MASVSPDDFSAVQNSPSHCPQKSPPFQAPDDINGVASPRDPSDIDRELLPPRLFATDRYPTQGRINSYSKPDFLLELVQVLDGSLEFEWLKSSCFGGLFRLPIRKSSLSGKLVHQILCRSLVTAKRHEMWFVFGGQPIRFSLREFGIITGLNCGQYPARLEIRKMLTPDPRAVKYFKELVGPNKTYTVREVVDIIKRDKKLPEAERMDPDRRKRLALLVIVDGILVCDSSKVMATVETADMLKDLEDFVQYPWGRKSFELTLEMVKVGNKNRNVDILAEKLSQSHTATHGFTLAFQLLILEAIPLLQQFLPDVDGDPTFTDRSVSHLTMMKTFHNSNILQAETDPKLQVENILHTEDPKHIQDYSWVDEVDDEGVDYIVIKLKDGHTFNKQDWHGGFSDLPLISVAVDAKVKKVPAPRVKKSVFEKHCKKKIEDPNNDGDDHSQDTAEMEIGEEPFSANETPSPADLCPSSKKRGVIVDEPQQSLLPTKRPRKKPKRFVVLMAEREVQVLCYWNGRIEYGSNGVYYDRSTPRMIKVKRKTELSSLLDQLYLLTGLDIDDQRSKVKIFGRYPSVVQQQSMLQFSLLPVVNDASLETMLEVPSKHPSIKNVELYLEVKSDGGVGSAACSPLLANPASSSKRQRVDVPVKLEKGNSNGWIEDEDDADMTDKNAGSDSVAEVVNLTDDNSVSHKDLNKDSGSGVSKPCLSSLWLDDNDLRVGLCFKDSDELKKAVDWCSIKGEKKCVVREAGKDECMFECVKWKCKWTLLAARNEKHGLFEIIKYTGPHTCLLTTDPDDFDSEIEAYEIERAVRVHPTLSFAQLKKWWKEKFGYELETSEVRAVKRKAIERVFGDWDQCFEDLPKLLAAFHSSNGLLVDWKYDLFPNPKFATFHGVFWAFSQSIEGFQHCRPLIMVDTRNLNGKYQLKLMIASGLGAANHYFPLAFAVTKEVSSDSWRWFLTGIREKVTQRKDLCLIFRPDPDILAVMNEPGSQWQEPWAHPRFCLNHLCSQFRGVFPDYYLENILNLAGSTSQKDKFDNYLKDIEKKNPEARKWLDQFPQNQWALAHDSGRRYGIMKIDPKLFEIFRLYQSNHVLTGQVLLMFDELRVYFAESFLVSRVSLNRGNVYTKPVMDKLEEFKTSSVTYVVMPIDNNAFKVTSPSKSDEWIVQLSDCTCTCGQFQNRKIPCLHALAVYKKLKINPLQYVDDCYTLERYCKTYAATFSPVPELLAWPEASGVPTLFPPIIPPPPPLAPTNVSGKSQRKTTTPKTTKKRS